MMMRTVLLGCAVQVVLFLVPWSVRRRILTLLYEHEIASDAHIGFSIVLAKKIKIGSGARIGSLNFIKGLNSLRLEDSARIGNLNWITGHPAGGEHYKEDVTRDSSLLLERHASITHRHLIDCTDTVSIGAFSIIAGWRSQILTHSIDVAASKQRARAVTVGPYCFVGTGCIILGGSILPGYSVLGAGSTFFGVKSETHRIYSGVPAVEVRELDAQTLFFHRQIGHVS